MVTDSSRWNSVALRLAARCLLACPVGFALPGLAQESVQLAVRSGDTLIGISQRYLDDPGRWPQLQRLNRVANPRRMPVGRMLTLPLDWLRWTELPAEVLFVLGGATVNAAPLSAGLQLKSGDRLDTGTQGSLTLRFSDGALVVFAPMTKATLGVSREASAAGIRSTRIDVQGGAVDSTATPLKESGSRFEIRTPRVVTAVRGTRFRVAEDDGVSRHEVLTGQVALTGAAPAPVQVAQGQGVRAEAGRLGAVVPLLGPPDLSGLPPRSERTVQSLQVAPMAGATGWRWQVASDRAFTQLLQDVKTREPVWLLAGLPDGEYQLRVRAADAQALEGVEAQRSLTIAARPEPPLLRGPTSGASVLPGAALVWAELPDAPSYHLQISRNPAFTDLVLDRTAVTGIRWLLDPALAPGSYHWRLATLRRDGSRGPFGDVSQFTLLEPSAVVPPQLDAAGLRLSWSGPPSLRHRVQVARDAGFDKPELDQVVPGSSLQMPEPQPGMLFVRTQVVLSDGVSGPWSAVQRFEVPKKEVPAAPFPWPVLFLLLLPFL